MPKKHARNAFFFYMQHFREEQKKKGIIYNDMPEVAEAAGPSWREASYEVRAKFDGIAKKEKTKTKTKDEKFTSTGVPLSHIARREQEKEDAEETEREDIINIVRPKAFDKTLLCEDFYVMDVNCYCKTSTEYIIGESTLLRFNLRDGVIDTYNEIINPGKIPMGYTFDVKVGCEECGLEIPDEGDPSDYIQILANTVDYLKQKNRSAKVLPPIFTMPDKVDQVKDFILQMCCRAGEDESLFRVYKLNTLFFHLANVLKTRADEGFPKESLALMQLKKDLFKYSPGIACEHHEESDKSDQCSLSRAKRWSYTVLDLCCGLASIPLVAGKHVPQDYDIKNILSCQEQKKVRLAPSIAGLTVNSSNTSVVSDSFSESTFNGTVDGNDLMNDTNYMPMRMPKSDYSKTVRQAPELTEIDFPALTSRGRGRGMTGSHRTRK